MKKDKKNNDLPIKQRIMALMALNTRQDAIPTAAPSDQEMSDFYANKLTPEANERIFAYLNSHPTAYTTWIAHKKKPGVIDSATHALSNVLTSIPLLNTGCKPNQSNPISTNIFTSSGARYAFAAAAIFAVTLLFYFPGKTDIGAEIDQYYAEFSLSTSELNSANLALPWELPDGTFSFTPKTIDAAPNRAFAAGLIDGKTYIISQNTIPDELSSAKAKFTPVETLKPEAKTWPQYAHLGLLNMLLWATTQKQEAMPSPFWDSQLHIVNSLKNKFESKTPDQEFVLKHLDAVSALISELKQQPTNSARPYSNLNKELNIARQRLAPVSETP